MFGFAFVKILGCGDRLAVDPEGDGVEGGFAPVVGGFGFIAGHAVLGPVFLGPFQQSAFGVDPALFKLFPINAVVQDGVFDPTPCGNQANIQVQGANKGLKGVRYRTFAVQLPVQVLAFLGMLRVFGEPNGGLFEDGIQAQLPTQAVQKLPVDDFGTHFGQKTFLFEGEFSKQIIRDYKV